MRSKFKESELQRLIGDILFRLEFEYVSIRIFESLNALLETTKFRLEIIQLISEHIRSGIYVKACFL